MINCNSKADSFPKKIQGLIEKAESNGDFAWRGFLVKKGMTFRKAQDDIMDGTPFSAVEFSIESAEPICAFDIFDLPKASRMISSISSTNPALSACASAAPSAS